MSQDLMQEVRHYITTKEYSKARAILESMEHPKRGEWLNRVDILERQHEVDSIPKPRNPSLLASLTFFLTPIISALLLAYNWRRFEKKSWMWWTILGYFVLFVGSISSLIGVMLIASVNSINITLNMMILIFMTFLFILLICSYPFLIAGRQAKAFNLMKQKSILAAFEQKYDWGRGILTWFIVCTILTTIGSGMVITNGEQHFDDGWLSVTVPFGWNINNVESGDYTCEDVGLDCHLVLGELYDNMYIMFRDNHWTAEFSGTQAMADEMWDWTHESDELIPIERDTITIGSHKAFIVTYEFAGWHRVIVFMERDGEPIFIHLNGRTQTIIDNNWQDIVDILATAKWTSE